MHRKSKHHQLDCQWGSAGGQEEGTVGVLIQEEVPALEGEKKRK